MELNFRINLYLHNEAETADKLDAILAAITALRKGVNALSPELQQLTTDVSTELTLDASVITLLNGLSAQLKNAAEDPAQVKALATQLETNAATITAALKANLEPVNVTPLTATVASGGSPIQFTADHPCTWAVTTGTGTIDANGNFAPPATGSPAETDTVTATATDGIGGTGTATVTVTAAS